MQPIGSTRHRWAFCNCRQCGGWDKKEQRAAKRADRQSWKRQVREEAA